MFVKRNPRPKAGIYLRYLPSVASPLRVKLTMLLEAGIGNNAGTELPKAQRELAT